MYDFSNFTGPRGTAVKPGGGGFDFGDKDISIRIKPQQAQGVGNQVAGPQAQGVGNQVAGSKPNVQGMYNSQGMQGQQSMQGVNAIPWQQIAGSKGGGL